MGLHSRETVGFGRDRSRAAAQKEMMRLLSSQLISIKPLTLVINMASDEVVYNISLLAGLCTQIIDRLHE